MLVLAKPTGAFVTRSHPLALLAPTSNAELPDPLKVKEEGAA